MIADLITTSSRRELMYMMTCESPRQFINTIINELQDSKTIYIDNVWEKRDEACYVKLKQFDSTIKKYEDILKDLRSLCDS